MMKFLIRSIVIVGILSGSLGLAAAENESREYQLDRYPGVGELFDWGMNVQDIEKALNQPLSKAGRDKYRAVFSSGGVEMDAICVIGQRGLEALVLQFNLTPEDFYSLLDRLREIFGEPTAVDTEKGAVQWKDGLNDTGIMMTGEKDGMYSVLAGLRLLGEHTAAKGLQPGKISSLEGITLGMSKENFLNRTRYFEARESPPEAGMPADTTVYQALLTFNLEKTEAFFEFNQDKLAYIMLYISKDAGDDDSMHKAFNHHLGFLSDLYGPPAQASENMVSWNDGASELRFGLHPSGTCAVSWELLK